MRLRSWRTARPTVAARGAIHGDAVRSLVLDEPDRLFARGANQAGVFRWRRSHATPDQNDDGLEYLPFFTNP